MKSPLEQALDYVFHDEGGYSNHPKDHGGATNFGITRETLSRWRKTPCSAADVKAMSKEEAKDIYEAWYWKPLACDRINSVAVAIAMFDIGVVRGIGVPPKYAQEICNARGAGLVLDGHIGPKTLSAINGFQQEVFIKAFSLKAKNGFLGIVARKPSQVVFLKGWLRRANRILTLVKL